MQYCAPLIRNTTKCCWLLRTYMINKLNLFTVKSKNNSEDSAFVLLSVLFVCYMKQIPTNILFVFFLGGGIFHMTFFFRIDFGIDFLLDTCNLKVSLIKRKHSEQKLSF